MKRPAAKKVHGLAALNAGVIERASRPAPARAAPKETVEVDEDVLQGSEDWLMLRLGMCTASNFGAMLAVSDEALTRKRHMYALAAEIIGGAPAEKYVSEAMERGKEMEPRAIADFMFKHDLDWESCKRVGFVKRTIVDPIFGERVVGCSPDLLIGEHRCAEFKTMRPDLMIELDRSGRVPTEHRAQCQGTLWVTGRQECDLVIYHDLMPFAPRFVMKRDDVYIEKVLKPGVEAFQYELAQLVADTKKRWSLK